MPLRVAHVNVARGYRGGERQTELLIRELAKRSVSQVLVARKGQPLLRRCEPLGVELRPVSGNPVSVAAATGGVDLVHIHEGRSIYGAYLRHLMSATPYIITRRVDKPNGNHWLAHQAYRRAARVVGISPQVAEALRSYDTTLEVSVIFSSASGLRVDAANAAKIRASFNAELVVGHVGALDDVQKRQSSIIDLARDMQHTHPEITFVLVGGGNDEHGLKIAAEGLDNVVFTGFVDNVGDYLAAFDIFVLPSSSEGLGSILLDAMVQRLPIVATRVGGVPSIVHDGENGLLVECGDHGQFRDAILRLRDAPELRRWLGGTGSDMAADFTPEIMCERYLELYRASL